MIGNVIPVTGAEIRNCKLELRPGADSMIGLTETTGVE